MAIVVKFLNMVTIATDMRPKLDHMQEKEKEKEGISMVYRTLAFIRCQLYLNWENVNMRTKQMFMGSHSFCAIQKVLRTVLEHFFFFFWKRMKLDHAVLILTFCYNLPQVSIGWAELAEHLFWQGHRQKWPQRSSVVWFIKGGRQERTH